MSTSARVAPTNRLLAALSDRSRRNFLRNCDYVHLNFAETLCEQGEKIRYVYFPLVSFVSLVTALDGGAKLEVGIVGDEGMLGISVILGIDISPQHALVQGSGTALRMTTAMFLRHFKRNMALRQVLHRYVYVLMRQLALNAACVHYHLVETRLARWLLLTRDRAHSPRFYITHEFLAYMLGVRRVGITQAATALQNRGIIEYRRGEMVILDNAALEKKSCRCYRQGQAMYDKLLGKAGPSPRQR